MKDFAGIINQQQITANDSSNFYIFVTSNEEICTEHTHAES